MDVVQDAVGLASQYQSAIELVLVAILVGVCAWFYRRDVRMRRRLLHITRGADMDRRERERFEKIKIADAIGDAIFELEFSGEFSRERAAFWLRRFANILDNDDLLSKHNKTLKQMLKDKLRGKSAGPVVPLPIPGPPPGAVENNVIPFAPEERKAAKFGEKYLAYKHSA